MLIQAFSENLWLYPDTPLTAPSASVSLDAARGGMVCLQLLTDKTLEADTPVSVSWENAFCLRPTIYQLLPVCVDKNSGKDLFTGPYEEVKDFVTREAPFDLFDAMKEIKGDVLAPGRCAFFVRFEIDRDCPAGERKIGLTLKVGEEAAHLDIGITVHQALIPPLEQTNFGMVNWIYTGKLCEQYGVEAGSEEFVKVLDQHLTNEIEMRNTHLQLPSGEPIRDEDGKVIGFDFTLAELVGNMALSRGFNYIMGGFVARFAKWDDPEHYLLWDREVGVASHEGYRQLKLYFEGVRQMVLDNGWEDQYMQTLVDEPQFPNSEHYRILSSICRKFLPGIPIHDPVESTKLDGALEIWCVKQAVYEKYLDEFKALQALGEEMWLYTCGFPAGKVMNRVLDLPLTASRLPMWLCRLYGCTGFLHWGYNYNADEPFKVTANPAAGKFYPPGNAHVIYPDVDGPLWSVRAQLQRAGAEDWELLDQLYEKDAAKAEELIKSVCRDFSDYTMDGLDVDAARKTLLTELDK